jgi:hypothetical protein
LVQLKPYHNQLWDQGLYYQIKRLVIKFFYLFKRMNSKYYEKIHHL